MQPEDLPSAAPEETGADETVRAARPAPRPVSPPEIDGPAGPEPTRYGDWERKGRCIDF
jgi:hypothetical protein